MDGLRAALYCASEAIRARRRACLPIPGWLAEHHRQLDNDYRMSLARQPDSQNTEHNRHLNHDGLIDTATAAELLGCTQRTIQRRAHELGGHRIGRHWVFDATQIRTQEKDRNDRNL